MINEFIAKIEGHGTLTVDHKKNKAQLKILEGERLFEGILVGREAKEAPWLTSRICGVCPTAHYLATLKAIENALGININETSILLRRLMIAGQMIQSHILHLFFLALPDYLGIDSGLELKTKNPSAFKIAITFKELADEIIEIIGGRRVHPITPVIGGFQKIPEVKKLHALKVKLEKNKAAILKIGEIFSQLKYPPLKVDLEFVSQTNQKNYPDYETKKIISSKEDYFGGGNTQLFRAGMKTTKRTCPKVDTPTLRGGVVHSLVADYKKDIQEEIRKNSTAKFAQYKKRTVLVGALARIFLNQKRLTAETNPYLEKLDFQNPFYNNLAQAIEVIHYYFLALDILNKLTTKKLSFLLGKENNNPSLKGIGALEAPRGGLYYEIQLNHQKEITMVNIITPTVQNLTSLEKSANALLRQQSFLSFKEKKRLIGMLIRAYDPCITCAVH